MTKRHLILGALSLAIGVAIHPRFVERVFDIDTIPTPQTHAGLTAGAFGLWAAGASLLIGSAWKLSARPLLTCCIALMIGGAGLGWWYDYPKASYVAVKRMGKWRNGSTLNEYSDAYLDWATGLTANLTAQPSSWHKAAVLHMTLGDYLLRIGRHQEAIAHFQDAHRLLEENHGEDRLRADALRWLGTANMRAGEVEFCLSNDSSEVCIFPLRGGGIWHNKSYPEKAIGYFEELLTLNPDDYAGRWLYNYAHMANGSFPSGVREDWRLPEGELGLNVDAPHFVNRALPAGVDVFGVSGGAIMDDFDGDGLLDLVASCCDRQTPFL